MGCVGQLNVRKMQKMNIKSLCVDGDVERGGANTYFKDILSTGSQTSM